MAHFFKKTLSLTCKYFSAGNILVSTCFLNVYKFILEQMPNEFQRLVTLPLSEILDPDWLKEVSHLEFYKKILLQFLLEMVLVMNANIFKKTHSNLMAFSGPTNAHRTLTPANSKLSVFRLQQEVAWPKARFKPTSPKKYQVDGGGGRNLVLNIGQL